MAVQQHGTWWNMPVLLSDCCLNGNYSVWQSSWSFLLQNLLCWLPILFRGPLSSQHAHDPSPAQFIFKHVSIKNVASIGAKFREQSATQTLKWVTVEPISPIAFPNAVGSHYTVCTDVQMSNLSQLMSISTEYKWFSAVYSTVQHVVLYRSWGFLRIWRYILRLSDWMTNLCLWPGAIHWDDKLGLCFLRTLR